MVVRMLLTILCVLIFCCLVFSAPVPKDVKPKPPEPEVGSWTIDWAGTDYKATLNTNGEFIEYAEFDEFHWYGSWGWDSRTRTLTVSETDDCGETWLNWTVVLDEKMKGSAKLASGSRVPVKMSPRK